MSQSTKKLIKNMVLILIKMLIKNMVTSSSPSQLGTKKGETEV